MKLYDSQINFDCCVSELISGHSEVWSLKPTFFNWRVRPVFGCQSSARETKTLNTDGKPTEWLHGRPGPKVSELHSYLKLICVFWECYVFLAGSWSWRSTKPQKQFGPQLLGEWLSHTKFFLLIKMGFFLTYVKTNTTFVIPQEASQWPLFIIVSVFTVCKALHHCRGFVPAVTSYEIACLFIDLVWNWLPEPRSLCGQCFLPWVQFL